MAKVHPSWRRSGSHFGQPYGFQEELYAKIAVPPGEGGLSLIGTYFPGLAALTGPRGKTYKSPKETELREWAAETFEMRRDKNGAELFRDLTKTAYITLHYLSEFRELFLQREHHHLDGRGIMHLWDSFSRAVIEPKGVVFGDEIQQLPPRSDDLRGYIPKKPTGGGDDPEDDTYSVSNHPTALPGVAEPGGGRTFDKLAGELMAFYRRGISERPGVWGVLRPMIGEITPLFASGDMTNTTPAVSSLGNVDPYIRQQYGADWEVDDVSFGDTATRPWPEGALWAWRDRLVLCSCYNSGFYTPRDVQAFYEKVAQTMMERLGLREQARP
ncbi:hypothetical protein DL768_010361 [Monosporascus sp. mg162]|nr:hypothetical protein DL768_010361 [Monosporascus sp. mg162]